MAYGDYVKWSEISFLQKDLEDKTFKLSRFPKRNFFWSNFISIDSICF